MMYLVKAGSLTVVARTPREATSIYERLVRQGEAIVQVTDLEGFAVDIKEVAAKVDKEE